MLLKCTKIIKTIRTIVVFTVFDEDINTADLIHNIDKLKSLDLSARAPEVASFRSS